MPRGRPRKHIDSSYTQEAVVENPSHVESVDISTVTQQEYMNQSLPAEELEQNVMIADSGTNLIIQPDIEGWQTDMATAPIDGSRIMVSETGKDQGVLVYWRISKFVDRKNLRYISRGRWTDFLSRIDIAFQPYYWKAYNPEEYWPLQSA